MARRAPKGESTKTDTLTVRVSPKNKYGLELLARKQNRTLAGVVEWAIDKAFKDETDGLMIRDVYMELPEEWDWDADLEKMQQVCALNLLWNPNRISRLASLYEIYPELLSDDERKLWELISKNAYYWELTIEKEESLSQERFQSLTTGFSWETSIYVGKLLRERVEKDLPILEKIVNDQATIEDLPNWVPAINSDVAGDKYYIGKLSDKQFKQLNLKRDFAIDEYHEEFQKLRQFQFDIIQELAKKLDEDSKNRLNELAGTIGLGNLISAGDELCLKNS